jgi:hypothetical protein
MSTVQSSAHESERAGAIAALVVQIAGLFNRLPMLSGFSVQDRAPLTRDRNMVPLDADLCIADVAVHAWPGLHATPAMCDEIVQAMLELLDDHPEARELLRGYTFARTFH